MNYMCLGFILYFKNVLAVPHYFIKMFYIQQSTVTYILHGATIPFAPIMN